MNYLICLFLSLTFFLPTSAQSPVPIEKEPRHRLKFSNQYVRFFYVFIPPGDTSLFHTHVNDGLSVRLSDARIRDEALGGTLEDIAVKRGAVSFGYRPSPLTHRVSSIGSTPFRNIFVEILPSTPKLPGVPPQALVAGQTLVLENERVRISRLVLAPGQSIEMHAHALRGLGVAVSEGRIAVEVPGEKVRTVKFKPGDKQWYEGGTKHSLRNVGSAPFEAVEIELK
ncbi:MAG: cupin domain-containing protein [Rubrivivax sp.]|nr:cupin domain-containing protein [Pyrinomonadaceae bacterium]